MRVKSRSGKRDFKYKRERDNAFLRGRDAGIVRYGMAGYDVTSLFFHELTELACQRFTNGSFVYTFGRPIQSIHEKKVRSCTDRNPVSRHTIPH